MPAEFFVEIEAPGFDTIKLMNEQIVSFLYQDSMIGCAVYSLQLATGDYGQFNALIKIDGGTGSTFRLRYGFKNDQPEPSSGRIMSDWKTLELLEGTKRPFGENILYQFRGLCHGNVLNRSIPKTNVWGNKTISEIVREIAGTVGLRPDVSATEGTYNISTGDQRCGAFIDSLRSLAYSSNGSDFRFWIKNGDTLVFKPVDTQQSTSTVFTDNVSAHNPSYLQLIKPKITKSVIDQPEDNSGEFQMRYNDALKVQKGKPFTGDIKINEQNSEFRKLSGGSTMPRETFSRVIVSSRQKDRNATDQTRLSAQREGKVRFSRDARSLYRIISYVPYTGGLQVGTLVSVLIQKTQGMTDINTGPWLLHTVRSTSTHGVLRSMVILEKRYER